MLKLSRKVQTKIVEPLMTIPQLIPVIQNIIYTSNEQIIFLDKVQLEIDGYIQRGFKYLHELIFVPREDYRNFFRILHKVNDVLKSIPRKKYYGKLTSQKGSLTYEFLFEYYISFSSVFKGKSYNFQIWEAGRENKSKFSFALRVMEDGKDLKVVDLFRDHDEYYLGKGISIAMILKSKSLFKKRIISSSNLKPNFSGEMRFDDATNKVWARMVEKKFAAYNDVDDYYYTV